MHYGTKRSRRPGHSPRQLQARAGNVGHASYQALCAQIIQSATTGKAAVQPSTLRRKRREGLFVKRQLASPTVEEHKVVRDFSCAAFPRYIPALLYGIFIGHHRAGVHQGRQEIPARSYYHCDSYATHTFWGLARSVHTLL